MKLELKKKLCYIVVYHTKEMKQVLQKIFMSIFLIFKNNINKLFFSQRTGSIVESFVDFQKQLKFKLNVLSHAIKKVEFGIFVSIYFNILFIFSW